MHQENDRFECDGRRLFIKCNHQRTTWTIRSKYCWVLFADRFGRLKVWIPLTVTLIIFLNKLGRFSSEAEEFLSFGWKFRLEQPVIRYNVGQLGILCRKCNFIGKIPTNCIQRTSNELAYSPFMQCYLDAEVHSGELTILLLWGCRFESLAI